MAEGPILIIKTGSTTLPRAWRGDFEDWFETGLRTRCDVVDIGRGEPLPRPTQLAGIVITGSPAMVSDRHPWAERVLPWLRHAVLTATPILGVCFGHQLLAHALGGVVGGNPRGRQLGTVRVTLADHQHDALLGSLAPQVTVQTSHQEVVLKPPRDSVTLGRTDRDDHHVLRFGPNAWGVQFHPEFDAAITRRYINARADQLRNEGFDSARLLEDCHDSPVGPQLLSRFAALADAR